MRKLSNDELATRTREANRRRSERHRERLTIAGRAALTVWLPVNLRTRLDGAAAADGVSLSVAVERLLTAALSPTVESVGDFNAADRNARIHELAGQGLSSREIAKIVGCGKTYALKIMKQGD